jgi:hypothetical protein
MNKVFCIGRGKTGTTSMEAALKSLGYRLGDQHAGERLIGDWSRRDFRRIAELVESAEAFQDVPFALDDTFVVMDQMFPRSKFILTVRESSAEWYGSLTRFHTKIVGKNRLPTADDLREFPYIYPGWMWEAKRLIYDIEETTLYNPAIYRQHYDDHVRRVKAYFRHRPGDLLVLNVAEADAMASLCRFLGRRNPGVGMPHLNRSR